ncbi:MAG: tRNA threonylcarbamoyladenosine biosynthesis protein TsaB [Oscillospiraceae bacterium]
MKILAIETSAKSVSAAVVENGVPLASAYQNMGLTHSRTLMPLVDGHAVRRRAAGPGYATCWRPPTGRAASRACRIGVSVLKGLAWALDKPCCGVVHPGRHGPESGPYGGPHHLRHGRPAQSGVQRPVPGP